MAAVAPAYGCQLSQCVDMTGKGAGHMYVRGHIPNASTLEAAPHASGHTLITACIAPRRKRRPNHREWRRRKLKSKLPNAALHLAGQTWQAVKKDRTLTWSERVLVVAETRREVRTSVDERVRNERGMAWAAMLLIQHC